MKPAVMADVCKAYTLTLYEDILRNKKEYAKQLGIIILWFALFAGAFAFTLYARNYVGRIRIINMYGGFPDNAAYMHAYDIAQIMYYTGISLLVALTLLSVVLAPKIVSGSIGMAVFVGMEAVLGRFLILDIETRWVYVIAAFISVVMIYTVGKRMTTAFLAWIVASPILYYFTSYKFAKGMPQITFDRVSVFLFMIFLSFTVLGQKVKLRKLTFGEIMLVLFVAFSCANTVFVHGVRDTGMYQRMFDYLICLPLIYFIAARCVNSKRDVTLSIICIAVVGFVAAFLLILEAKTGCRWSGLVIGKKIPLQWTDVGEGRGQGLWGIPHTTQIFCVITIYLSVHLASNVKKLQAKLFYIFSVIVQTIAIFYAYSRTGYVALGLAMILMPLLVPKGKIKYALLPFGVGICLLLALPTLLAQKDFTNRMQRDTVSVRMSINETNIALIKDNLLFGVGYGQVTPRFYEYVQNREHWQKIRKGYSFLQNPHNWHLQLIGEEGLIGAFLFYTALIYFILHTVSLAIRLPNEGMTGSNLAMIVAVATFVTYIAFNFYGGPKDPYPLYILWIMFALMSRLNDFDKEEKALAAQVS
ncbi:MAG: O-antigen ligase family protein [Abditibacteriota bacterium]|nr:O-antigen ligase family protein [Abditibacteriota bacterium]